MSERDIYTTRHVADGNVQVSQCAIYTGVVGALHGPVRKGEKL